MNEIIGVIKFGVIIIIIDIIFLTFRIYKDKKKKKDSNVVI